MTLAQLPYLVHVHVQQTLVHGDGLTLQGRQLLLQTLCRRSLIFFFESKTFWSLLSVMMLLDTTAFRAMSSGLKAKWQGLSDLM